MNCRAPHAVSTQEQQSIIAPFPGEDLACIAEAIVVRLYGDRVVGVNARETGFRGTLSPLDLLPV